MHVLIGEAEGLRSENKALRRGMEELARVSCHTEKLLLKCDLLVGKHCYPALLPQHVCFTQDQVELASYKGCPHQQRVLQCTLQV